MNSLYLKSISNFDSLDKFLLKYYQDMDSVMTTTCHKNLLKLCPTIKVDTIKYIKVKSIRNEFKEMNPCIVDYKDGNFLCLVRTVSYNVGSDGGYRGDSMGLFRTINYLLTMNSNFETLNEIEIKLNTSTTTRARIVSGDDDIRMKLSQNTDNEMYLNLLYTSLNYCNTLNSQMVSSTLKIGSSTMENIHPLKSPYYEICEKNWIQLPDELCNGRSLAIYGWGPLKIIDYTNDNVYPKTISEKHYCIYTKKFRGGTNLIKFDNGYLTIVHEVNVVSSLRHYYHRFVYMEGDSPETLTITKISSLIKFIGSKIEYAMALILRDDHIIVSLGVDDVKACIITINVSEINLKDINLYL